MTTAGGRATRRLGDPLELIPVPLVVLAEAAWLSVVAGLAQEFVLQPPSLSIPALVAAVIGGLVVARLFATRLGSRWPRVALVIVVAAGVVGWLAAPFARDELARGIGPGLLANPGGFVLGLAVLRGIAHTRLPLADDTVGRLLAVGAPGIALCAVVGGIVSDPYRSGFLADTTAAAIVFVGSAVLALTFTRLAAVGLGHGLDWRRNRAWLGLALLVLAGSMALALPVASLAGATVAVVAGLAFGPIFVIGLATGLDRTGRRIVLGVAIVATVLYVIMRLGLHPRQISPSGSGTEDVRPQALDQMVTLGLGGLLAFLVAAGILILVAVWMRRTRVDEDLAVAETRTVDRGGEPPSRRPGWRPHRRREPADAVAAYVELVHDLERQPDLRRRLDETPAEHAGRLRAAGAPSLALDLLAADYALVRDGGATLTSREDRRGVGRWRHLRTALVTWAREREAASAAGPAMPREDLDARPDAAREDAVPASRRTG